MGGGIEWAAEQKRAEQQYREHVKSGLFNKDYLETDIVANLDEAEIKLLVYRLVYHHLGGWGKYISEDISEDFSLFHEFFETLSVKTRKSFVKRQCLKYGFELAPTKKMDKLHKKIKEMEIIMYPRSEE